MTRRARLRDTKAQTTNAVHRQRKEKGNREGGRWRERERGRERKRETERERQRAQLLFVRIAECPLGAEGAVSRDWERGTARSFRRCCFPF